MDKQDREPNNILAWMILGYWCSHPQAKDTATGISTWWLRVDGASPDRVRVMAALEYLEERGWVTTRGEPSAFKVYGLNQERQQALQTFLHRRDLTYEAHGQETASIRDSFEP